jgi:hypothetical protein
MDVSGPVSVQIDLPADPTLVRLARLVVSGVASTVGMLLDEVESCRAAIDELCSTLLEVGDPGAELHLRISTDGPCLVASGEIDRSPERQVDQVRSELSRMILASVVDDHELSLEGPLATFRFEKRSQAMELR